MAIRRELMRGGDETIQQAEKAGLVLARVGFAMRGVLYALIGIVTLYMACGIGKGGEASKKGAIQILAGESWGLVMLVLVVVGFVFYGLWLLSMAIRGDRRERGWKGVLYRVKNGVKAGIHFFLAFYAFNIIRGRNSSSSGSTREEWTAKLIQHTAGRILLGLIGLGIIVAAAMQFKKAWQATFMDGMGIEALRGKKRKYILIAGRVGFASRGFILGLVGLGVALAAWDSNPNEAKSIDGTLHDLLSYPYGKVLIILMAIGFWCFAVFQIACAAWARME